jgi:4-hydroxybenzoate polyprenyltransferase
VSDQEAEEYICRQIDRLPPRFSRSIHRLRFHGRIWQRLLVAALLIFGGLLWFLPILGFWMLPFGVALLAIEIPIFKRWLVDAAMRIERWWCHADRPPP